MITFSCCSASIVSTASAPVTCWVTRVFSLAAAILRRRSRFSVDTPGTAMVSNGNSCWPRSLNPHPATRLAKRRTDSARFMNFPRLLDNDVHQAPRHHDHLLRRLAVRVPADGVVLEREALDRRAVGRLRCPHVAAQLAVHLQHELDLVGFERRLVDLGPARGEGIGLKAELPPEGVRDVRRDRG